MPADTKLYLYLDPRRLVADSIWTFDASQFAGWVPHQMIAYAWPSGPWYVVAQAIGLPDWVAHRLWIGTIMLAAGTGVAWAARRLGFSAEAALAAGLSTSSRRTSCRTSHGPRRCCCPGPAWGGSSG